MRSGNAEMPYGQRGFWKVFGSLVLMMRCAGTRRTDDIHYKGNQTPFIGLIPLPPTAVCKASICTVKV